MHHEAMKKDPSPWPNKLMQKRSRRPCHCRCTYPSGTYNTPHGSTLPPEPEPKLWPAVPKSVIVPAPSPVLVPALAFKKISFSLLSISPEPRHRADGHGAPPSGSAGAIRTLTGQLDVEVAEVEDIEEEDGGMLDGGRCDDCVPTIIVFGKELQASSSPAAGVTHTPSANSNFASTALPLLLPALSPSSSSSSASSYPRLVLQVTRPDMCLPGDAPHLEDFLDENDDIFRSKDREQRTASSGPSTTASSRSTSTTNRQFTETPQRKRNKVKKVERASVCTELERISRRRRRRGPIYAEEEVQQKGAQSNATGAGVRQPRDGRRTHSALRARSRERSNALAPADGTSRAQFGALGNARLCRRRRMAAVVQGKGKGKAGRKIHPRYGKVVVPPESLGYDLGCDDFISDWAALPQRKFSFEIEIENVQTIQSTPPIHLPSFYFANSPRKMQISEDELCEKKDLLTSDFLSERPRTGIRKKAKVMVEFSIALPWVKIENFMDGGTEKTNTIYFFSPASLMLGSLPRGFEMVRNVIMYYSYYVVNGFTWNAILAGGCSNVV
ncbi:hypothetical protein EDB89DRAFT_1904842 [Lactarius sanguifluus]|nr:hypothetical protein EDB89DRAFT_1904842 [Lactarius sanguifluus]